MKQAIISLMLISSALGRPDFHNICREIGQNIKFAAISSVFVAFPTAIATPLVAFAAEEIVIPATVKIEQPKVVLNEYIRSTSTGIEFYDYKIGDGPAAKFGDKVAYNYKGRLAGRPSNKGHVAVVMITTIEWLLTAIKFIHERSPRLDI
jgi:hypothetical protein